MNTKTFVKTKNVKKFVSLMDRLKKLPQNIPKLALVYGDHGLGKTKTLIWWATKNDAIYIRANNDITQNGLLKEILLDLNIHPYHSMQDNLDEIVKQLKNEPKIIIVDEVDYLFSRNAIEILRDIQDLTGTPIILSGMGNVKKYGSRYDLSKWIPLRDSDIKISSQCCKIMKKKPSHQFERKTGLRPFVATMAAESNLRKQNYLRHGCNSFDSKNPKSTPLGFWTEQDILQYIKENNLPYCSVYGDILQDKKGKFYTTGAKRTGCMFCMFGVHTEKSPNKFELMKQTHPKVYDYCINQLGCGKVLDFLGVNY